MNWHEFVFSEKPAHRTRRHIIFWLLWWIYFAATYYYYLQVGLQKVAFGNLGSILLVKSFLLILIHLVACYFFIYILLPRYLLTKKYFLLNALPVLLKQKSRLLMKKYRNLSRKQKQNNLMNA